MRNPEFYRKGLQENWKQQRIDVIPGQAGWLPDADWAASKMKVYRMEAVLKQPAGEDRRLKRTYFQQYLALFGRQDTLAVAVTTEQDPAQGLPQAGRGDRQVVPARPGEAVSFL